MEAAYGFVSNSTALLADAGHNLSDVFGLVLAWAAVWLSRRRPTARHSYGLGRSSILAALANAVLLLIAIGAIVWEALSRFSNPHPIATGPVVWIALVGIAINAFTAWLFMRGSKTDLNVIALIGIVLLIGIVKKNAILMIDFALEAEREHKLSSLEAVREACRLRFRPILMTTLAALLGALPLVIGSGAGSELRRPLGMTIIGGLIVSQLLTLFTTPIVYLTLARVAERRRRVLSPASA